MVIVLNSDKKIFPRPTSMISTVGVEHKVAMLTNHKVWMKEPIKQNVVFML